MAGLAQGGAVQAALAASGVAVTGYRWQWLPGIARGVFFPHYYRHNKAVYSLDGWPVEADGGGAFPGMGFNGKYCMCTVKWILRDAAGRWAGEQHPEG